MSESPLDTTPAAANWVYSLPLVQLGRGYQRQWFRSDLVAGSSVCVVMIPSIIAYAELAGLPPVQGLYASLAEMARAPGTLSTD